MFSPKRTAIRIGAPGTELAVEDQADKRHEGDGRRLRGCR